MNSEETAKPVVLTDEVRAFLTGTPRIAKVGTKRKNGDPWVQPAWFGLDGNDVVMVISTQSLLGRSIQRESYICLCVDDVEVPYGFVVLEGSISVVDDPDLALHWAAKLTRFYRDDVPDPEGHASMLRDNWGLTMIRIRLDNVYFEPVVSPAPAPAANGGIA